MRQLLFVLLLSIASISHAQLVQKVTTLELGDTTFQDITALEHDSHGYRLFLTGENHLFQNSNKDIQFHFLRMLHERHGVNNLIIEFGASAGQLIDKYVVTGDSATREYLDRNFAMSHMRMWDSIRHYNASRPDSEWIRVLGVDLDRHDFVEEAFKQYRLPVYGMDSAGYHAEVLTASYDNYPNRGSSFGGRGGITYNAQDLYRACLYFIRNPAESQMLFADSSDLFMDLVLSYREGYLYQERGGRASGNLIRERYMASKVQGYFLEDTAFKAMGQFGRCHVELLESSERCPNSFHSFSSRLERMEGSVLGGKILSIPIVYKDEPSLYSKPVDDFYRNILDELADSLLTGPIYLLELDSSQHFAQGNYRYAIYNTTERRTEGSYDWVTEGYWEMNGFTQTHFGASYIRRSYGLSGLNDRLRGFGFPHLANEQFAIGGELTTLMTDGGYNMAFSLRGEGMLPQTLQGPSGQVELSAWQLMGFWGYPFPDSRWVSFTPMLGLGGGQLKTVETWTASTSVLGGENVVKSKNPAFLLGASADLRLTFYMFSINASGGYQLDVGNKDWKRDGVRIPNSPSSSMKGWYLSVGASFYFKGY